MAKQISKERGWTLEPIWYDTYWKFGKTRRVIREMAEDPESAGESSWGTRNLLYAITVSVKPEFVLEIGAHIGSASVAIASGLKRNNYGKLISLEPADHYYDLANNYLNKAQLGKYVEFKKLFSTDSSIKEKFKGKYQVIFLDANHSYSHAFKDLELAWSWLADDGILIIDDVGEEMAKQQCEEQRGGVRQALIDFAEANGSLSYTILEHPIWLNPCGIAILTKRSNEVDQ
jgi:predicted O-methyltransferase YrrM